MCPRKQYSYTSEDYLNRYLDKYARKFREDAKFWPQFIEHISGNHKVPPHSMVFYAEPKAPKTKRAWITPYPLKLSTIR